MAQVLAGGAAPKLLKRNDHEVGRLLGAPLDDEGAAIEGARTLRSWGVDHVVITRGGEGCVAATAEGDFRVPALPIEVNSAVGAGDASLAGLLLALVRGRRWAEAPATATAAGAATCLAPGAALCRASETRRLETHVRVEGLRQPAVV